MDPVEVIFRQLKNGGRKMKKLMRCLACTLRELEDLVLEQNETMPARDETMPQDVKDAVLDGVRADVARIKQLGVASPT